jgi:transcriptional regulator with XRE-family HTH domain
MGADQRKQRVRRRYDRLAGDYEGRWDRYVRASNRETLARLGFGPGQRLMDLGYGTGALLAPLSGTRKRAPTPIPPPPQRGHFASSRLEGLPDALRFLRERHGWSQEQLARRMGTHRPVVSAWECGSKTPSLEAVGSLAEALDLDLGDLDDALSIVNHRQPRPFRGPLIPQEIDSATLARLLLGTPNAVPLDEDHADLIRIIDLARGILRRRDERAEPTPAPVHRRRRKPRA